MQRAGEKEGVIEEGEGESFCAYLKSCLERDLLLGSGFKQNIRALPSEGEGESKLLYAEQRGLYKNPSFCSCKANYKPNTVRSALMAVWTPHVCKLFDRENPQLGVSKRVVDMKPFFSCRCYTGMTWGHIKTVISVSFHPLLSCLQYRGFPWTKPFFFLLSVLLAVVSKWANLLKDSSWKDLKSDENRTDLQHVFFFFFPLAKMKLFRKEQKLIPAFQRLWLHQNSGDTP